MSARVLGGVLRVAPSPPVGAPGSRQLGARLRRDFEDGGDRQLAGTVMVAGTPETPVARRVRLYDKRSGRLVRETWSDAASGAYVFGGIRPGRYFVVTHDHTLSFNAAIADEIAVP